MRLLLHNSLRNNTAEAAKGKNKGFPLRITASEVRVDDCSDVGEDSEREVAFVKGVIRTLDWPALVQAASEMGLPTALPKTLSEELANDPTFLRALYHVLMNVHLVRGILTCPDTGKEFAVTDGIPNFSIEEEESENVRT